MTEQSKAAAATKVIDAILAYPPATPEELVARLQDIDRDAARNALVYALEGAAAERLDVGLVCAIFAELEIGSSQTRLLDILRQPNASINARRIAVSTLLEHGGPAVLAQIRDLPPGHVAELLAHDFRYLLTQAADDAEAASTLAELVEATPKSARETAFWTIERLRRETATSAASAYQSILRAEGFAPLHKYVVAAIAKECNPQDIPVLEQLLSQVSRKPVRQELQRIVTQARQRDRGATYASSEEAGTAHVQVSDGQSAFSIVGAFRRGRDRFFLTLICIRATADFRDGLSENNRSQVEVDQLVAECAVSCSLPFVKVPLSEAAVLVREAAARTRQLGSSVPRGIEAGLEWFGRLPESPCAADAALAATRATEVDADLLRAALNRPENHCWFFDHGDLVSANIAPFSGGRVPASDWVRQATVKINRPHIRTRLSAMTWHMARWYYWSGEHALAALFAATHRGLTDGDKESPLFGIMLEKSVSVRGKRVKPISVGDPEQRQYLRQQLFTQVTQPTARDMRVLDLTEVAYGALDRAIVFLPGERRPRSDQLEILAGQIGETMSRELTSSTRPPTTDAHVAKLTAAAGKALGASKAEVEQVMLVVLMEIGAFVRDICAHCPLDCFTHPSASVRDDYFSGDHPAEDALPF